MPDNTGHRIPIGVAVFDISRISERTRAEMFFETRWARLKVHSLRQEISSDAHERSGFNADKLTRSLSILRCLRGDDFSL
jgi:hypothetical protein